MNLNLDFYNDFYNTTNYSSNVKSYTTKNTVGIPTENKKINSISAATAATVVAVTEIPVISNEIYNRMFVSNNLRNLNNNIIEFLKKNEDKTFAYYNYIKLRGLKEYE